MDQRFIELCKILKPHIMKNVFISIVKLSHFKEL